MGTRAHPRVAVVIPVFHEPEQLGEVLRTVQAVDWPREALQVIVAVDGPHSPTEERARAAADTVVVLPQNAGSYTARNAALDRLDDDIEYVAFTDADCYVSPGWVREHVHALQVADLSGGDVRVTLRERAAPAEYVDRLRHLRQEAYVTVDGYAATANLAVRRSVLEVQRFRSDLRSGGDAEFGREARQRGLHLTFAPAAWVEHPARRTEREVLKKVVRIGRGIRANPERWLDREISPPRLTLRVARLAYRDGMTRSPVWLLRAVALNYLCDRLIYRAAQRSKQEASRRGAARGVTGVTAE